jgi:Zn-dependent protease
MHWHARQLATGLSQRASYQRFFCSPESGRFTVRNIFSMPDEGVFRGQSNDNFELLKAWAGTTLAFAIAQVGGPRILSLNFLIFLVISGIVCGLGFVLHELAHRIVARRYGAEAHFIANNAWLLISIVVAFAGFFIAAPGAVWHRGYLTERQGGLIALAGPATNLVFALLFLLALPVLALAGLTASETAFAGINVYNLFFILCLIGYKLNAFIGLFNMIPAGPFDGAKVLAWSPLYFGITVAAGIVLTFVLDPTVVWQLLGVTQAFRS